MLYDFPAVINHKILIYASIKFDMELICKMDANVTVSTPGTDIITLNHECNHHTCSTATAEIPQIAALKQLEGRVQTHFTYSSFITIIHLRFSKSNFFFPPSKFNSSLTSCRTST